MLELDYDMKKLLFSAYKKGVKLFTGTNISKNSVVKKTSGYLTDKLKPDFIQFEGGIIYLDEHDLLSLSTSIHEKTSVDIVKKEVKQGDIVIDVGANIGYYTLLFAKLVGPTGHVYSFEASPKNCKILQKNIEANNYKNVTLIQKAVSNKDEQISFYTSPKHTSENFLFKPNIAHEEIKIQAVTLDNYFENQNKIDFMKIDIAGAESLALERMDSILKRNNNMKIIQEWWPNAIRKHGKEPDKHLNYLIKLGYKIYEIDDIKDEVNQTTVSELMMKYPNSKMEDINLFCKK